MSYIPGTKYIRNRITGAIFPYRQDLEGLNDLEVVQAVDESNVDKIPGREPAPPALNPTKTPEKKSDNIETPAKSAATAPTLAPVKAPD